MPVHVAQRQVKVRKIECDLSTKLSREPTDEEIAAVAELPVEEIVELRELSRAMRASISPSATTARRRWATCSPAIVPDPTKRSRSPSVTSG